RAAGSGGRWALGAWFLSGSGSATEPTAQLGSALRRLRPRLIQRSPSFSTVMAGRSSGLRRSDDQFLVTARAPQTDGKGVARLVGCSGLFSFKIFRRSLFDSAVLQSGFAGLGAGLDELLTGY